MFSSLKPLGGKDMQVTVKQKKQRDLLLEVVVFVCVFFFSPFSVLFCFPQKSRESGVVLNICPKF